VDLNLTQFKQNIPYGNAAMRQCGNAAMRQCGNAAMRQCGNAAMRQIISCIPTCLCQLTNSEESLTISFSHFGTKAGFFTGFSKSFSFENG